MIGALSIALLASACSSSSPGRASADSGTLLRAAVSSPEGNALGSPVPPGVNGWSEALSDPQHSSSADVKGPTTAHLLWQRVLGAPITAGAIAGQDGTVYDSANDGVLHAIDPLTGRDKWVFTAGQTFGGNEDLSISAALLSDGTILWPAPAGRLDAISTTGKLQWSLAFKGAVLSPAVHGDAVYVTDSEGDLSSISATSSTGTVRWTTHLGSVSFGSPALGPDGTVYATADDRLIAVKDSGSRPKISWTFRPHGAVEVSPSVGPDGTVILGTNDGFEYGLTANGAVRWRYPLGKGIFSYSTPAVTADGLAYFGDNNGDVHVIRASTGTVIGRYQGESQPLSANGVGVWTAPAIDGQHDVFFGTASGHVFGFGYNGAKLFDIATGNIVASYPALIDGGTLLIGSDNGTLYALRS